MKQPMILTQNSTGFDLRDACVFSSIDDAVIACDNLFSESFPDISFIGYDRKEYEGFKEQIAGQYEIVTAEELHKKIAEKNASQILPTGFTVPTPYLKAPEALVERYVELLNKIKSRYGKKIFVPCLVSGLKPVSDSGKTEEEQRRKGWQQTLPFEDIAEILKEVQNELGKDDIVFYPISTQYWGGQTPEELCQLLHDVSADLWYPIDMLFGEVDWQDKPEEWVAFYQALQIFCDENRIPLVGFGHLSTWMHAILGTVGNYYNMCLISAMDSFPREERDGRIYWHEVTDALDGFFTLQQHEPGNWKNVKEGIKGRILSLL